MKINIINKPFLLYMYQVHTINRHKTEISCLKPHIIHREGLTFDIAMVDICKSEVYIR